MKIWVEENSVKVSFEYSEELVDMIKEIGGGSGVCQHSCQ